eukprot:GILK01000398.1.p1 GENE.GILK01000398.1~~GILK01000398.1.p1  ORF type:complete len:414 (-),score=76.69 GILK01000398.1:208-1449(-)
MSSSSGLCLGVCVVLCLFVSALSKDLYDPLKSEVKILNSGNYDALIKRNRDVVTSIVQFHLPGDRACKNFAAEYIKLAADMKGIVRVGAVDCEKEPALCEKEAGVIDSYPHILIIPPNPIPIQKYENQLTAKDLAATAVRFVPSQVAKVTSDSVDTFLTTKQNMPKVLLFTNKKQTPLLLKGLSNFFKDRMHFGQVADTEERVVKKYKVKKFPTIMVFLPGPDGMGKQLTYNGDMKYDAIFEWLNPYAETFVQGGGFHVPTGGQPAAEPQAKPWLTQTVPELTKASSNDVCLKSGGLCAIFLSAGKPSDSQFEIMEAIANRNKQHIQRGTPIHFMWLDTTVETQWVSELKVSTTPALAVFNPGKRKRFTSFSGQFTSEQLNGFIDKVIGGDAKFSALSDTPKFVDRAPPATGK